MTKPTILITGACGELGHGLIEHFTRSGSHELVCLDLKTLDSPADAAVLEFYEGDLLDKKLLDLLFRRYSFDIIFHLAALLSTSAEKNPVRAHDVNVNGSFHLLEYARKQCADQHHPLIFMLPSTIAVYGMGNSPGTRACLRVKEDQFLNPLTIYGMNKLYIEQVGYYFATRYGTLQNGQPHVRIDFRALRFPGILSADTVPSGGTSDYAPEMLHAAARGEDYSCFVTQQTCLPFMALLDAVKALVDLAAAPKTNLTRSVYNVGAFTLTVSEIESEIRKYFPESRISYHPDKERLAIIESWPCDLDDSAARSDWNWRPKYDLKTAFAEYLVPGVKKRYAQLQEHSCRSHNV